jgi:tRNA threonylcarbamoyl adenosine modification protein (Sua5/YciO/YrdC/YwlC family)
MIKRFFLHKENPKTRDIKQIAASLEKGSIAIIPTDTVYALACIWTNKKGIDRLVRILGKKEKKLKLSLICRDVKMAADYTLPLRNNVFRTINRLAPGPFTFILESNIKVQRAFRSSKKEIGIRIPSYPILDQLIDCIGAPLVTSSLSKEDEYMPYYNDPEEIIKDFNHSVDMFIDVGQIPLEFSTVLNCISGNIELIRQGKGQLGGIIH